MPRAPRARRELRGLSLTFLLLSVPTWALAAPAGSPAPVPGAGDATAALRQEIAELRRDYEQRLAALEAKLQAFEAAQAAPPAPPPAPPPATPAASGQAANYFNPAISLIGNFLAVGGHNPVEHLPGMALRESELGLQAIVDPYARADVFLSFGEEGVGVEEGYLTFTSLPADLLAKVGRMRVLFGKVNSLHLHVLPWPDEPLPVVNLLGGEEGWIGSGVSVARLIPLGDTFSELTLQAVRGQSDNLFAATDRWDLAYNGHYKVFGDLSDAANLEVGLSYAQGPNGTTPSSKTRLYGLDATYRWKPLQTGLYKSLLLRGEIYRSDRSDPAGPGAAQPATGWYAAADYQLARRWFAGARLESSDRAADARRRDTGQALTLTFWPSEFSQLRAELRRRRYAENLTANELLLQLQFAIGAHGAHPF